MSTEPYIGTIMLFAGNFAPLGWAQCDGQLLPIAQYNALFSLIGTTYGGDGQTTFALPDLRSRVPLQQGTGPGLGSYVMGENGGAESVTLTAGQIAAHSHQALGNSGSGTQNSPAGGVWAGSALNIYGAGASANAAMSPTAISTSGGGQPHDNMLPFTAFNFCIALEGIFPAQS